MIERLKSIREEAIANANLIASLEDAEEQRIKFLGKKGLLTEIMKGMKDLSPDERKSFGAAANTARAEIEKTISEKIAYFKELKKQAEFAAEKIDVTEPGTINKIGTKHLISITIDEISKVFMNMGFSISEGPEVETVFNNFDALNAGPNPVKEALDSKRKARFIFIKAESYSDEVIDIANRAESMGLAVYELSDAVFAKAAQSQNPQGVLGVFEKPHIKRDEFLSKSQ